jgi:RNA polymerase sigma-70 factor (ECF subfamily)
MPNESLRMPSNTIAFLKEDDATLVAAVRQRQSGAATRVYRRHARAVQAFIFRRLGSQPDTEDILQEVFASAFGSIDDLREPSSLRSWLFSIATSCLRQYNRGRRRKRWLCYLPIEQVPETPSLHDERHAKLALEVRRLLEQLTPDEQTALFLHRVQGLSLSESAEACGMTVSTFKRRLSRGEARFLASAARREALSAWLKARR